MCLNELFPILSQIPGWDNLENIQVEPIAGLTNQNYRVTVNDEQFVLRVSGKNTQSLGIDRQQEAAALKSAARLGLGPDIYALLLPEGHLVTRWVDGQHWEAEEFRTPQHVRMLTEIVKRVHSMPPNGAVFSPFRRVEAYIKTAGDYAVRFPSDFDGVIETMQKIETEQRCDPSDWQHFCHNDLVSVNYLYCKKDQTIKILDWEFAGWGDIYYDLATVVYTHDNVGPISPALEKVMLECYFGEITQQHHRRLNGMKYMLMLFSGMWGLMQHGLQSCGLIPAVKGFDYLEYAQYLFEHEIKELKRVLTG